ncbi:MAG: adenosylmethionine--8-amino-7-oxononanoate transaminase [Planctomycetaceae bacterium]|nr:adenosylmethionine--8-amino-7-oxononanoate transaminase [Planctomycetaceae bacterium]
MDATEARRLHELDRTVLWHAFSQMSEYDGLIIERAEGSWLTDIHGKKYFDGASSLWCNLFGHRVAQIDRALIEQLGQVAHVTNLGMSHPVSIRLAERLTQIAGRGLEHVFFAGDGASAVEVAMKLAFQYWRQCDRPEPGRTKFLALGDAYHGDTIGTVSVSGVSLFQKTFAPLLFEVLRGPCPDDYRRPQAMSSSEACAHYLEAYEAILIEHHRNIAAVIAESCIQGAAGFVMQPKGFLAGLAKLCKKYNVLLILDEIAVGMGRTGRMFAFEHEEIAAGGVIEPDFLCLGKGLTGGYIAMSATLSSRRIWEAFLGDYTESKTFFHGHTYGGNPLAAAAGLAVLDLLEGHLGDGRFSLEAIRANSECFAKVLEPLDDSPIIGQVRRLGMMAALVLVASKETKSPFEGNKRMGKRICEQAISRGLWLRPLGDVIPILPAVTTPPQELDWLGETLSRIFQGRDFTQSPQF